MTFKSVYGIVKKIKNKEIDMKYLVFSDSHGTTDDMLRIMQTQPHDAVIHLGDINADVYKLRRMCFQETICAVIGNNDWFCDDIPKQIILPCRGKKIFA